MNIVERSRLFEDLHRPKDLPAMAAEIRRLHTTGLKPRDISAALRIDVSSILHALCGTAEID